jgi:DNA-binding CsgD family transcriptional regulator
MTQSLKEGRHYQARADWTARQKQVLDLLAQGLTNAQIADALGISLDGAKYHVSEVITRLGVDTREEAAEYWRAYNGWPRRFKRFAGGLIAGVSLRWAGTGFAAVVLAGIVAIVAVMMLQGGEERPASVDDEATPNPTAPSGPPSTPVASPPSGEISGPLYRFSRSSDGGGREVVYFDLGAEREVWSVRYGSPGERAVTEIPLGSRLLLVTERGLHVVEAMGTGSSLFHEATEGWSISGAAASRDDAWLAVAEVGPAGGEWRIDLLSMDDGSVLHRFTPGDAGLGEFEGIPTRAAWHMDNDMLAFHGVTEDGGSGSLAVLLLSGEARVYQPDGWPIFSPDGSHAGWMEGDAHSCLPTEYTGTSAVLFDLRRGVVAHGANVGAFLQPNTVAGDFGVGLQWSQDSYRFAFAVFEAEVGGCGWANVPARMGSQGILDTGPGWNERPLSELIGEMTSGPLLETACPEGWKAAVAREPGGLVAQCPGAQPMELRVNGIPAGIGAEVRGLGIHPGAIPSVEDGTVVFVGRGASFNYDLVIHDLRTGESHNTRIDSHFAAYADGVAYYLRDGAVRARDIVSGAERVVVGGIEDGVRVPHVAASPDGRFVALSVQPEFPGWRVVVLDTTDFSEVSQLDGNADDLSFMEFGYAWQLQWREDSRGVTVRGGTDSERPGGLLTMWLDGTYTMVEGNSYQQVAPNGQLAVTGLGVEVQGCMFINSSTFDLLDLETAESLHTVRGEGEVYSVGRWAPDSSEYLFPVFTGPFDDACDWTRQPDEWRRLDLDGNIEPAADPRQVDPWRDDFALYCDGAPSPPGIECQRGSVGELRMRGILISATYLAYDVLAFVE